MAKDLYRKMRRSKQKRTWAAEIAEWIVTGESFPSVGALKAYVKAKPMTGRYSR